MGKLRVYMFFTFNTYTLSNLTYLMFVFVCVFFTDSDITELAG